MPINNEVAATYLEVYNEKLLELTGGRRREREDLEREAQKYAIKETALRFFQNARPDEKKAIWNAIYAAHIARKSGILVTRETVVKVISADQSWKKSSGHAFEEIVKELSNMALEGTGIQIILQRDVDFDTINNEAEDKDWLRTQTRSSVFDLFAMKDGYIFGCIQAKTSIRDRVTRDREPSRNAMARFFWSIVFVLDGDFLRLPKFQCMVNGGSQEFEDNGWHALYAFSLPNSELNHRIKLLDSEMTIFKMHAVAAANEWFTRRQWFTAGWMPREAVALKKN